MLESLKVASVLSLVLAAGGAKFGSTWRAPDTQVSFKGQKVVALVMHPTESVRRSSENTLARELIALGIHAMPGYTVLPSELVQAKDRERGRELVEKAGAVGIVSLRLVNTDKEITATAGMWTGPYYGGFWGGYYSYGWGAVYDPGYVRTDQYFYVETLVFDLRQNKLVWAGTSKSKNPKEAEKLIKDVVSSAAKEIKKSGLVAPR